MDFPLIKRPLGSFEISSPRRPVWGFSLQFKRFVSSPVALFQHWQGQSFQGAHGKVPLEVEMNCLRFKGLRLTECPTDKCPLSPWAEGDLLPPLCSHQWVSFLQRSQDGGKSRDFLG